MIMIGISVGGLVLLIYRAGREKGRGESEPDWRGRTAMPYDRAVISFIETRLFTRLVEEYLSDDEYRDLQHLLLENPEAGSVVRGSGGVRKLRWHAEGRGKRGGYRVIYFARIEHDQIWMLTMYPKNVTDDIPANVLRKIRKEIEND
jgi:hypothetical protein